MDNSSLSSDSNSFNSSSPINFHASISCNQLIMFSKEVNKNVPENQFVSRFSPDEEEHLHGGADEYRDERNQRRNNDEYRTWRYDDSFMDTSSHSGHPMNESFRFTDASRYLHHYDIGQRYEGRRHVSRDNSHRDRRHRRSDFRSPRDKRVSQDRCGYRREDQQRKRSKLRQHSQLIDSSDDYEFRKDDILYKPF